MTTDVLDELKASNLTPLIGSAIHLDKAALLSGEHASGIRELLERRGVLVFPKIGFSDEEQVAFTKTLGEFAAERGDGENIHKISLDPKVNAMSAEYLKGSLYWHIDGTMSQIPILASLLSGKVLSPSGGDTQFSNTYAAWTELPEEDKQQLEGLRAAHGAWPTLFYYDPEPSLAMTEQMMSIGEQELPLVWKHRSGRKSLVIGATAHRVIGMEARNSTALLVRLREWATQPRFVYTHKWTVGDLVIWDNTGTMHRATPYDPNSGRLMHRTKLRGEEAFA
ncbi:MAG: Taurine catabolism dioxygenase [Hydrocarboniphaga sp.]|uniref:TauD/TfdA dioxygenase family protein n=1 Tax=Hydrocarboniphaga sp. TaxID=2033016 RepID=UPI00261A3187|nr:TauD/TfdA family dioxygenase [Hydrocarboniphaga sp.]MDB5968688.1 Taurine catabolism dioxygenase [Hydrocarboniphaga sp.]